MKHSSFWQAAGFAVSTLFGTILHFLYDWTGGNTLAAIFSGVNESTWEHMKLLYWPLIAFAVFQYFFFRDEKNYWWVKLAATALGLMLIPVLFYTYNGMFGKSPDWVNIAIFYIAAATAFGFEWWAFRKKLMLWKHPQLGLGALVVIGILFVIFTFATPRIPLFQDPVTGGFGI
jgi:hypothetical protein